MSPADGSHTVSVSLESHETLEALGAVLADMSDDEFQRLLEETADDPAERLTIRIAIEAAWEYYRNAVESRMNLGGD
jgi:hypothetical protein